MRTIDLGADKLPSIPYNEDEPERSAARRFSSTSVIAFIPLRAVETSGLIPDPLQGPLGGSPVDAPTRAKTSAAAFGGEARRPPRSGSMNDNREAFGGGVLQALCPGLVFRVHVVVLDLAHAPAAIAVDDPLEHVGLVVEGESDVADTAVLDRSLRASEEVVFEDDPLPALSAQGVEEIDIDVVGPEPGELFAEIGVEIRGPWRSATRETWWRA